MRISELIENLRQIKSEMGNVSVYIYDPHDPVFEYTELDVTHFDQTDTDDDGHPCLLITAKED